MARHHLEPVRQRLSIREQSSRTLDQWLSVRFPRLARRSAHLIARMPPTSRIRQSMVLRTARLALEAYNRRDLKAVVAGWDPDFEYFVDRDWVEAGLAESCYRGLDGYVDYITTADEVWWGQNHLHPLEVIDLGDQIMVLAEVSMRGQASGVPLTMEYAAVLTLRDGVPVRCDEYFRRDNGFAAVGLSG